MAHFASNFALRNRNWNKNVPKCAKNLFPKNKTYKEDKIMTNFILSAIATIVMAVAAFAFGTEEPQTSNQLTENQQIEIYESVMVECVINK